MKSISRLRNAAIAYVVYCEGSRAEWNVTLHDLAAKVSEYFADPDITVPVIQGICRTRKAQGQTWMHLMRCASPGVKAGWEQ